jgi:hypothetical protein
MEVLKFVRTMHHTLVHSDKHLIIDALFSLLAEKNKEVRMVGLDFCKESVMILDEEYIETKIREQKTSVQDTLRQAVGRIALKRPPLHKLERDIRSMKQIKTSILPMSKLDIEANFNNDTNHLPAARIQKPNNIPVMPSNSNFSNNSGDFETAMRQFAERENASSVILSCVSQFGEPTDTEVQNIGSSLSFSFNDSYGSGLFSFETSKVRNVIETLKTLNVFSKKNILKLLQYCYIRVFDNHRKGILEAVESLLEFMANHSRAVQYNFFEDRETVVVFHALFRLFLTSGYICFDLLRKFLKLINPNILAKLIGNLLGNPICAGNERLVVAAAEFVFCDYSDGSIDVTREFILGMKSLEEKYSDQISRILQSIQKRAFELGLVKDRQVSAVFEGEEQPYVYRSDDLQGLEHLLARFKGGLINESNVIGNAEQITNYLLSHGKQIILYDKFKELTFKSSQLDIFFELFTRISQTKELLFHLTASSVENLFEQLIFYLIKVDSDKDPSTGKPVPKTVLDELISNSSNVVICKFFEYNSPNITYPALFALLEKHSLMYNNEAADSPNAARRAKFIAIVRKSILKINKTLKFFMPKINLPRLLQALNSILQKHNNTEKNDFVAKDIRTLIDELIAINGESLLAALNDSAIEEPHEILKLIRKALERLRLGHDREESRPVNPPEVVQQNIAVRNGKRIDSASKTRNNNQDKTGVTSIEIEERHFE